MPCLVPSLSNPIQTCLCKIALLLAHISADMLSDALAALHVLSEAEFNTPILSTVGDFEPNGTGNTG